jgi:hypothetical protein
MTVSSIIVTGPDDAALPRSPRPIIRLVPSMVTIHTTTGTGPARRAATPARRDPAVAARRRITLQIDLDDPALADRLDGCVLRARAADCFDPTVLDDRFRGTWDDSDQLLPGEICLTLRGALVAAPLDPAPAPGPAPARRAVDDEETGRGPRDVIWCAPAGTGPEGSA